MREVFATIAEWLREGRDCALGTLVASYDSAPAPIGTTIAVDAMGRIAGNIGAGCYEGDLVEACMETIRDGAVRVVPINLRTGDEISGAPGCGGSIKVAVWKPDPSFVRQAEAIVLGARSVRVDVPQDFAFTVPAKRRLIVIGATSLAQAIARCARALDFVVCVADPRPPFLTRERIPDADELANEWPDVYLARTLDADDAVLVISHDPKFDLPALRAALLSEAWYIGLLGSRRSQAARRESLREMGFSELDLARIHGPTGLDLGGVSTAETALSILAQIVALQHGRGGAPLERVDYAIHERPAAGSIRPEQPDQGRAMSFPHTAS